jgi:putative transposase
MAKNIVIFSDGTGQAGGLRPDQNLSNIYKLFRACRTGMNRLVLDALLMALWRRQPRAPVIVHSDQGCQFTGHEWQTFLRDHNLVSSMSRRGNCHDNAVAESFFQLLKRERIRRRVYATRDDAKADVFNYIEMFYNSQRRHSSAAGLSPVEFEQRHSQRLNGV